MSMTIEAEYPRPLTVPILLSMIEYLCRHRCYDEQKKRWLIAYEMSTDPPVIRLARALVTVASDLPVRALAAVSPTDVAGAQARLAAALGTRAGQEAAWALIARTLSGPVQST